MVNPQKTLTFLPCGGKNTRLPEYNRLMAGMTWQDHLICIVLPLDDGMTRLNKQVIPSVTVLFF